MENVKAAGANIITFLNEAFLYHDKNSKTLIFVFITDDVEQRKYLVKKYLAIEKVTPKPHCMRAAEKY